MKWSMLFLVAGIFGLGVMFANIINGTFELHHASLACWPFYAAWLHADLERASRDLGRLAR